MFSKALSFLILALTFAAAGCSREEKLDRRSDAELATVTETPASRPQQQIGIDLDHGATLVDGAAVTSAIAKLMCDGFTDSVAAKTFNIAAAETITVFDSPTG